MSKITIVIECPEKFRECGKRCWGCPKAEVISLVPHLYVEAEVEE